MSSVSMSKKDLEWKLIVIEKALQICAPLRDENETAEAVVAVAMKSVLDCVKKIKANNFTNE